ncbi:SgcJ/EcaC family oxidoreductase [Nitratireductor sp. ZSWI3]|uniref:YybH family protein n=1 Tax=Nitratireductor sp. ZSWI3 TaxID=2966359 RepID=UPI00215047D0|nr:SgcJ/EcaC family oxidoreductase [Nitratireductor sp. ZSWI3]MCR4268030.1 SgcJ/EcaC family oxidoreductase [Nitratireductor sp. ZSWI3]
MFQGHGSATDLKAIDRVRDDHVAALNAGDADKWVAQFSEDGVQMPPNAPANVGKNMIRSWSRGLLSIFRIAFNLDVDEVRVLDDWAFERGGYSIKMDPIAGGQMIEDTGKYITIYQKNTDDTWRIARDIWNSSRPLSGM